MEKFTINSSNMAAFPRLSALLLFLSILITSGVSDAATPSDATRYATSFFSIDNVEQVEQLNRKLSEHLSTVARVEVLDVTYCAVTSKEKRYFRSIVITDKKGRKALKKVEDGICSLVRQEAMRLHGIKILAEPWTYRLTDKEPARQHESISLHDYEKIYIRGAKEKNRRFVILIAKFAGLDQAEQFCRILENEGVDVILGYPRRITIGTAGKKMNLTPFRVFLRNFEGDDLVFGSAYKGKRYVVKNKENLEKTTGKGHWNIYDAGYSWQLVPKKKHNFLIGSFQLDLLPSKEEHLRPYLDALEERGLPFYLTTVRVKDHNYLRVVHPVDDDSQLQIDLALAKIREELNDFSVELGKDFNIHPEIIPKDDPIEGAKFTLDDLVISMSEGTAGFLKDQNSATKGADFPVSIKGILAGLFLPRISPLQNDLKGKNTVGLKVIKTTLPGKGEHTCLAIERNYRQQHIVLAEKLKASGKILTFFVYRRDNRTDLRRLAQLAAKSEIDRRQAEAADIAELEEKEAWRHSALGRQGKKTINERFGQLKYIIEDAGYSKHIQPVVLYKDTQNGFSLIDEIMNTIDLYDCQDLAVKMKSLMWAESRGNPHAISGKNARGPLQVTVNGYRHTRKKFAELIRMAENAEQLEKDGDILQAQDIFSLPNRRLLENAWRLVDLNTGYNDVSHIPRFNICEGTLQFLIDYTFFAQRYVQAKPEGGRKVRYPYQLRQREHNHHSDAAGLLDPEIAAMASYNYGRYGVIKAIKRKGGEFVQALPRETRRHLANYFVTKLSLDQEFLAEYKKSTRHDIAIESPRQPHQLRRKIRKGTS
jgi:hypothetical protein